MSLTELPQKFFTLHFVLMEISMISETFVKITDLKSMLYSVKAELMWEEK